MGIVACVEPTTTVASTTTATTAAETMPPTAILATSGTTVVPTSVGTTTACRKEMATVDGPYVSKVNYTVEPVTGTNNSDLTATDGRNGISFPEVPGSNGTLDDNNKPLYIITIKFKSPGVESLGSVSVSSGTNVNKFAIEFLEPLHPDQPITTEGTDQPFSAMSTTDGSGSPSISLFPSDLPSPLIGIRFIVLSTSNNG